jgi:hypothetical protein
MGNQVSFVSESATPMEKTTSLSLWKQADADFAKLKMQDDQLRELYALDRSDPRRPDAANPLYDLSAISNDDLIKLRKQMRISHQLNIGQSSDDRIQVVNASRTSVFPRHDTLFKYQILSILKQMPDDIRQYMCMAGGALVDMIIGRKPRNIADYDLFVVGTMEPEKILVSFIQYLNSICKINCALRTRDAVTLSVNTSGEPLKIQVILRSYASPSEVVTGFDLDASAICWYEGQLYMAPRALYSLETMCLFHDVDRMSTSYNHRLLKYSMKKGFCIRLPRDIPPELKSNAFEHIKTNQGRFLAQYYDGNWRDRFYHL